MASLLVDFWAAACGMAEGGEEGVSSIALSAPSWDERRGGVVSVTVHPLLLFACHCYVGRRWGEWHRTVFPLLEASVLAAGLGRTLGIVCFHPQYETPSDAWLARHRFGHMHSPSKLRRYLREHDAVLAASTARAASRGGRGRWSSHGVIYSRQARSSESDLRWAGSYQRRSPHALINVLWARQLEAAELRRATVSISEFVMN